MKKFQFRLAVVEKHRRLKEQEERVKLSRSLAELRAVENKLLDLDMREVEVRREFAALGTSSNSSTLAPNQFWMLDQFVQGQKVRRVDLKATLMEKEQNVGMAYADFLKARQQKKLMEKLREKNEADYKESFRKYESRITDEQYVMRDKLTKRKGGAFFIDEGEEDE